MPWRLHVRRGATTCWPRPGWTRRSSWPCWRSCPERIQYVVDCTARQVQELRQPVDAVRRGASEGLCGDAGRDADQPAAGHPSGHPAWQSGRRRPLSGLSAAAAGGVRHPARLRVPLATGGAAAAGRQARGRPDLRRAAVRHRPVPAGGPCLRPVEAVEGHRPGHGIALEPAQRGADVVVPRLQPVRTAIQRRRAEVPPLRHGQPGPAAAVLRVCGLRGPAGRDADPR